MDINEITKELETLRDDVKVLNNKVDAIQKSLIKISEGKNEK